MWWQERLPEEQGRTTVVRLNRDGERQYLLPAPWDARTRVHEYGGRSYLPVPAAEAQAPAIVFANNSDQRLYLLEDSGKQDAGPRPLTPAPGGTTDSPSLRYADFTLSPDRSAVWCVREQHEDTKVSRAIVAVPLDGSAAEDPAAVRELVTGSDFYAFPTPSPDGSRLAWISWNHPRMPWDGTELRVARVENGVPGKGGLVKGGIRESVLAPVWRDAGSLYLVSDWPGWWNLYEISLAGDPAHALYPAEEEFAGPLWQLGHSPYAVLSDGRLAVLHGCGGMRLGVLDPESGELTDLDIPYPVFLSGISADGMSVVGVAGGPTTVASLIRVDTATGKTEVIGPETPGLPDPGYLPEPRQVEIEGRFGQTVHALVYPPANPDAHARKGERPPYVVWAHGGPTSHVLGVLDLEKAYFTSRGIGIVDVNYGGSTGYGRTYRDRLRQKWGVVDLDDVTAAARALTEAGEADGKRLAIRGGSAGGWTALVAATAPARNGARFGAATSYYGVTDLRGFASQTHDFEAHYLETLVGPLPGFAAVYAERSPAGNVSDATCPILLFQGLDDRVVVPAQARSLAAALARHRVRHTLVEFAGESHGFRRAETVVACLQAELSFYGRIFGFTPPGIPAVTLTAGDPEPTGPPAS